MHLVREKVERPGAARRRPEQHFPRWPSENGDARRGHGHESRRQRAPLQRVRRVQDLEFYKAVQRAPEVSHFVFPETARKREHANDDLAQLRRGQERPEQNEARAYNDASDADKARDVEARPETPRQNVEEYDWGVIEGHLFEEDGAHKQHARRHIAASVKKVNRADVEAEHHRIVLEVAMVDEHECGLKQDCGQRNVPLDHAALIPLRHISCQQVNERDVERKLAHDDRRPHIGLEVIVICAAGCVECKPHGVHEAYDLAAQPRVVRRQGRVVEPPPLEIVEVPLGDWQPRRDLHPVPLRLEVPVHRRAPSAGVRAQSHSGPNHHGQRQHNVLLEPLKLRPVERLKQPRCYVHPPGLGVSMLIKLNKLNKPSYSVPPSFFIHVISHLRFE